MTKGQRKWTSQLKQREKEFTHPLLFCSLWGLKGLDDAPPALGKALFFTQSAHCNAALLWKRPHRRTQKERFSSHLGLPGAQSR